MGGALSVRRHLGHRWNWLWHQPHQPRTFIHLLAGLWDYNADRGIAPIILAGSEPSQGSSPLCCRLDSLHRRQRRLFPRRGAAAPGTASAARPNIGSCDADSPPEFFRGFDHCHLCGFVFSQHGAGAQFQRRPGSKRHASRRNPLIAPLVVWIPLSLGAGFIALAYGMGCGLRFHSIPLFWRKFATRNWLLTAGMGVLGFGGMLLYGLGASGRHHPSKGVAWGLYMCAFILMGNALGFFTGEWQNCSRRTRVLLGGGIGALLGAVVSLASCM